MAEKLIEPEVYQARLMQLWSFAGAIERLPIVDMLAAAHEADRIGALLDPTGYREKGPALKQDIEMMEALRAVQTKMSEFREKMEAHIARPRTADANADNAT